MKKLIPVVILLTSCAAVQPFEEKEDKSFTLACTYTHVREQDDERTPLPIDVGAVTITITGDPVLSEDTVFLAKSWTEGVFPVDLREDSGMWIMTDSDSLTIVHGETYQSIYREGGVTVYGQCVPTVGI